MNTPESLQGTHGFNYLVHKLNERAIENGIEDPFEFSRSVSTVDDRTREIINYNDVEKEHPQSPYNLAVSTIPRLLRNLAIWNIDENSEKTYPTIVPWIDVRGMTIHDSQVDDIMSVVDCGSRGEDIHQVYESSELFMLHRYYLESEKYKLMASYLKDRDLPNSVLFSFALPLQKE